MKFNKTALFLAVSAIASVSVAHLATDLTAESPTTELVDAQNRDNAPEANSIAAVETIAPVLPEATVAPSEPTTAVTVAPVADQATVAETVTETPPALASASALTLPPPPHGSNAFVGKGQLQKASTKETTVVTQGFADSTTTSQSDSASTVRADKSGVAMSSEILFGFGGHKINPEARTMLDRIIPKLKAMDLEIVLATGHADRIGTDAANDSIAIKRANTVRDYFIKAGIPAEKIKVDGKGSSESVAVDCEGKKGSTLRDCLSPDRRVNVVAQGFGTAGTMDGPITGKASTASSARLDSSATFTVFFDGTSIKLKATDNDLLDEIADAAIEADKVHLRGRSAIGDSEQRKARAIARGWAVRQGLVFRGVEKEDIRIFYRTKGMNPSENNERVDVELIPRKVASK